MRYFCSVCKKTISQNVYSYSVDKFNKPLCRTHQLSYNKRLKSDIKEKKVFFNGKKSNITPEARQLASALMERGVPVQLEKWDGFKHIDIAITESKVNIEVDGQQHNFNTKQALSDLKRTYFSFKKGYLTLRIPNSLVKNRKILEETADFITRFLNESLDQLEDEY